jgi:hypothetical protein
MNFHKNIIQSIIQPNYITEINSFINGRRIWRSMGLTFETTSRVLIGTGTILSFASGIYQNTTMSFIAGSVSTISLICLQFSSFCYHKSKKSTEELNIILDKLKIDTIPEVLPDDKKEDV